ncbi:uncharacterized protein LOC112680706 [Sipha flava]|uniref:Uncharacterized protein LOC112680706 n=1 Tax=Sipha flava TaxID=143950 RepID=A0A8B8F8J9_9HEMI|nr:uncharacterized protein LOC112680706 [Sipha flava]
MIMEKMYRVIKPMYITFIDLEKAFDNVNWEILFNIMKTINIDFKDRRIIHKLYLNEKAVITDKRSKAWEEANIEKGVRQGCNLSPTLFNLYIENTLKQLREEKNGGIKINGMLVQMLRFADDIALIAESEEALGNIKQKFLSNITIENEKLETIQCFTYQGSKITHDGRSEMDIKSRIAQAKQAFYQKKHLLTANTVSLNTRKNLIKSFVWSIALYGAETWTILKAERKKIEAFETWCWRRALKIFWTEKVKNEEVYLRMNEQKAIWTTIKERRKKWIGHIMRNNEWITTIIEGKIEGKAGRGRPRTPFMKQIIDDIGETNYKELKVAVMDRDKWRAIKVI